MMMNALYWKGIVWIIAAVVAVSIASDAEAQLDCDGGDSINAELQAGETFVEFTGTCTEFVSVFQDGTEIRGVDDPSTDIIDGGLSVVGATRVVIRDLTITGSDGDLGDGDNGIFITNGAYADFRNVEVSGTENGVVVTRNAALHLRDSALFPALADDANLSCNPLCVGDGSFARIDRSEITGDTDDPQIGGALVAFRDGAITIRGGTTIANTGTEPAVGIFADSSLRFDKAASGDNNVVDGDVSIFGQSFFQNGAGAITGDVTIDLNSTLRLGGEVFAGDSTAVSVDGDIVVKRDSNLIVDSPEVEINGDVTCEDRESSVDGSFEGNHKIIKCTGYSPSSAKTPPGQQP